MAEMQVRIGSLWRYKPGSRGRGYVRLRAIERDGDRVRVERADTEKAATGRREWVNVIWLTDYLEEVDGEGFEVVPEDFRSKVARMRRICDELEGEGVPEHAVDPIREHIATLGCESCGEPATSGPHGPDSVYLCDGCLESDLSEQETITAIAEDK